jgi:hypothetical protein
MELLSPYPYRFSVLELTLITESYQREEESQYSSNRTLSLCPLIKNTFREMIPCSLLLEENTVPGLSFTVSN